MKPRIYCVDTFLTMMLYIIINVHSYDPSLCEHTVVHFKAKIVFIYARLLYYYYYYYYSLLLYYSSLLKKNKCPKINDLCTWVWLYFRQCNECYIYKWLKGSYSLNVFLEKKFGGAFNSLVNLERGVIIVM